MSTLRSDPRFVKQININIANNKDDNLSYAWKIDRIHNDWIYQDENSIQIGMLPYGEHKLSIKGKSSKTGWSPHQLSIDVFVFKPFYLQTWFILLSLISISSGVVAFFKIRTRVLKREIDKATKKNQSDKQIIEQQAEDLKELDKVKSRFFANVSQELRTPLSLMLGPMKDLLDRDIYGDKDRKLVDLMHGNTMKLRSIVNELLDLSKLENNKMELNEEPVEFYDYLETHVSQYASFGDSENKLFKFKRPENLKCYINLDKSKFEKIINNFFSNAMKFTPPKGSVTISVVDSSEAIEIAIKDTGIGIHPKDLPHVFNRFYQSKWSNTKQEGGTGIGLAFCKELAELMNGSVWAESVLDEGSTFYFKFLKNKVDEKDYLNSIRPQASIEVENQTELPTVIGHKIDTTKTNKDHQILIAEDNPDLRAYYQIILEEYDVILFENGKLALDHLQSSKKLPDLIITDLMMPVMDGLELITILKSNDSFRHISLTVLTAKTDRNVKIKALRIGIDDYINKPFDSEELLIRIENMFSRNRIKKEEIGKEANPKAKLINEEELNWLESLEDVIIKNLNNDLLNVNFLCKKCSMSESTLQHQLKKLTGLTPKKYIQEHRLNFARELLENKTYKTITQISYKSGFKDPNSFARSFKSRFGITPSEVMR